ncbi:unnamed protein product [Clonostachys byssicola]|uniref:Nuclear GTPase SLIP-GC n=1 Tax=Clonostachys byssicola TaxID=160290 RepID=A0A9N9UL14_9HYPO|nr:unnamed protein product [Clonostachys byssicola]
MSGDRPPPEAPNPAHPEMSHEDVVKKKEDAVLRLFERLASISEKITARKSEPSDIDLSTWNSTYEGIEQDYEKFFTYIGICGDTGLGKTMLLNTLIGDTIDIAPSSQQAACTAAVCCFHNHYVEDGKPKFIAKVTFKSKEAVEQELASMFQEMKDLRDRVEVEGPDEITRNEEVRFQEQIKVISGWSGFSPAQVKELGLSDQIDQITSCCESAKMFFNLSEPNKAKQKQINADTPQKFLREVTPFVGSVSNAKRGQLRWPLVELVRIWLESPLLSRCPGLVLVDLPGQMDALDSRSQVARGYYDKLDKMLIVTPADRAQDNRTATELICADQIYDLEASGKLDDDSIAIIITKVDQLDWEKYVNTEADPDSISPSFTSDRDLYEEKSERLRDLQEKIVSLKAEDSGFSEPISGNCSSKRAIQDSSQPSSELTQAMNLRHVLEGEVKKLYNRCLMACIQSRSKGSVEALQTYFDQVRNSARQTREASTVLSVFPVSSKAQQNLARKNSMDGFPDSTATGFSALEDWIVQATLSSREIQADNILYRCKVSFDAIEEWAVDKPRAPFQLPRASKPEIEQVLKEVSLKLKADLKRSEVNLPKFMGRLEPYRAIKNVADDPAINGFSNLIDRFQKDIDDSRLHWSTYAACIRRQGRQFRTSHKPRKTHCWEARLYGHYWAKKAHVWNLAFTKKLSAYFGTLAKRAGQSVSHNLHATCNLESLPLEYRQAFGRVAYKGYNLAMEYQSEMIQTAARFRADISKIRLKSRAFMNEPMKKGYIEASQHHGKGMVKKQIQTMHEFAVKEGDAIIASIGASVAELLTKSRGELIARYKKSNTNLVDNIGKIENQVLKQLCSGSKHAPDCADEFQKLRHSLLDDINLWKEFWESDGSKIGPVRIPPCEEALLADDPDEEEKKKPKQASKGEKKPRKAAAPGKKAKGKAKKPVQEDAKDEWGEESEQEESRYATPPEEKK